MIYWHELIFFFLREVFRLQSADRENFGGCSKEKLSLKIPHAIRCSNHKIKEFHVYKEES